MKQKKGVTMIEMVIVVLILILLAITAIWPGKKVQTEAELANLYSEFKALHAGTLKIKQEYDMGLIEKEDLSKLFYQDETREFLLDDWHAVESISSGHYNEGLMEELGIEELKRNYEINIMEGDVRLLAEEGEKIGEYKVRTYEDIVALNESGAI